MKLTTTVYKYKRGAPWLMALIILLTAFIFYFTNVIGVVLLIIIAVYAVLRPKSFFSIRSVDERKLVLGPDEIIWGTWKMPIQEVEKLDTFNTIWFFTWVHLYIMKRW